MPGMLRALAIDEPDTRIGSRQIIDNSEKFVGVNTDTENMMIPVLQLSIDKSLEKS